MVRSQSPAPTLPSATITGISSIVLSVCGDLAAPAAPSPLAFLSRNLEQEISFDFGPSGEFAYLYSQCYELTTNECVTRQGQVGGWAWRF